MPFFNIYPQFWIFWKNLIYGVKLCHPPVTHPHKEWKSFDRFLTFILPCSQLWSIVWNFSKSYGVPIKWIFADHRGSKNLLDFVIDYSHCQMGPIWCLAVICRDIFWLCFYGHKKPDAPLFGILSKVRGIRVQKLRSLATNSIYSLDEAIDAIW